LLVGDFDGDGDVDLYNQAVNELYVQSGVAPLLMTTAPANGATGVVRTTDLSLTFSEAVQLGSGSVTIRDRATHAIVERLDVGADTERFDGAGTTTITIRSTTPLPFGRGVSVFVSPGAFVSAADGDAFAGIDHPLVFAFTTAVNADPLVGGLDGTTVTFTEGDPAVALDDGATATITDADSPAFDGGTVTITIAADATAAEDVLRFDTAGDVAVLPDHDVGSTVSVGGVAVGTVTAGGRNGSDLAIALGPNATPSRVASLVHALQYANTNGDDPATAARTIAVTVEDGDGGASTVQIFVAIVAINDAPSITGPTTATVDENTTTPITALAFADPDAGNAPLTLTLTVTSGALDSTTMSGVTATGSGTPALTLIGSTTALNDAIAAGAVSFASAPGDTSDVVLSLTLDDGGNTGIGGARTAAHGLTFMVVAAPVDDPPAPSPTPDPDPTPQTPTPQTPAPHTSAPPSGESPIAPGPLASEAAPTDQPAPAPEPVGAQPDPRPEPRPNRPAPTGGSGTATTTGVPTVTHTPMEEREPEPLSVGRVAERDGGTRTNRWTASAAAATALVLLLLLVLIVRRRRDDEAR
jgi:hypothetical protein